MIKRFSLTDFDSILALAGAILSLSLIAYLQMHIGQPIYVITGVLAFLACVTYLLLKWRQKLSPASSIADLQTRPSTLLLLDAVFFALFAYSLWSWAFRAEVYVRPLPYFISIALMSAVLGAKILFLPSKNWRIPLTLFQIILIALSLELSVLLLFPSIVGIDPWKHQSFTLEMLDAGHTVPDSYQHLPVMHLVIGTTSLITTLNYKMATMFSISSLQVVCDVLFVFLIGRLLFNAKIGLLAALLMGVANWHVYHSYWATPNALGATFVVIIVYLLLRFHKEKATIVIPVFGLLMLALVLTHTIAALWMSMLLFALWLCFVVYNRLFNQRLATLAPLVIAFLFSASLLAYWTFGSGHIHTLARIIGYGFNPNVGGLTQAAGRAPLELATGAWETLSGAPLPEFLFNSLGMFLFFAVAFIGCFYMLSKRFGNSYAFFMAIAGVLILSTGYFPMLAGRSVIEHRWWYMAEILVSVPLAVALGLLSGLLKRKYLKAGLVAISVFVLTFLMIMGLPSNMDNRTFSQNQLVRYAFTSSELQALATVSGNCGGVIAVDNRYVTAGAMPELRTELKGRLEHASLCLLAKDFSLCYYDMILIRDEVVTHPIGAGSGTVYRLSYDPREFLAQQGFGKTYDCSSVSGFIRQYPISWLP